MKSILLLYLDLPVIDLELFDDRSLLNLTISCKVNIYFLPMRIAIIGENGNN